MIRRQVDKLREQISEQTGLEIEDVVLLFEGPSYWLWIVLSAIVGAIVFGLLELSGLLGGAIVGATFATWYFVATPTALAVAEEEALLVKMRQPLMGTSEFEQVLIRHPRGAAPIERDGRKVTYGSHELESMPFWGARTDQVVDKAAGGGAQTGE